MVKQVLRDYIYQWRNIKERRVWDMGSISLVYTVGPTIRGFLECSRILGFLYLILPLAVPWMISRMFPNELPLIAHLCPLSIEEKRKYLVTGFWIRILFSIALYLMLLFAIVLEGAPISWYMLADFMIVVPSVFILNLYVQPPEELSRGIKGIRGLTASMTACEFLVLISQWMCSMLLRVNVLDGFTHLADFYVVGWKITGVLMLIAFLYMFIRYYSIVMSIGTGYREDIEKEGENR